MVTGWEWPDPARAGRVAFAGSGSVGAAVGGVWGQDPWGVCGAAAGSVPVRTASMGWEA